LRLAQEGITAGETLEQARTSAVQCSARASFDVETIRGRVLRVVRESEVVVTAAGGAAAGNRRYGYD